jgi:sec-independent protein translocase protein TatC
LNFAGVLSGRRLIAWWRWIVILVALFAAVATPTGDPINMVLLGGPILILIVVAIGVCLLNDRRRNRKRAAAGLDFSNLSDDEASPLDPS